MMMMVVVFHGCQNGYLAAVSKLLHCRQLFPAADPTQAAHVGKFSAGSTQATQVGKFPQLFDLK